VTVQLILPWCPMCSTNCGWENSHRSMNYMGIICPAPGEWIVSREACISETSRRGCMLYLPLARVFRAPARSCTGGIYWRKQLLLYIRKVDTVCSLYTDYSCHSFHISKTLCPHIYISIVTLASPLFCS